MFNYVISKSSNLRICTVHMYPMKNFLINDTWQNSKKIIKGAHIRTGQKYECLVHICLFVLFFLARPKNPVRICDPPVIGK